LFADEDPEELTSLNEKRRLCPNKEALDVWLTLLVNKNADNRALEQEDS
jgi:hypothetical protein